MTLGAALIYETVKLGGFCYSATESPPASRPTLYVHAGLLSTYPAAASMEGVIILANE